MTRAVAGRFRPPTALAALLLLAMGAGACGDDDDPTDVDTIDLEEVVGIYDPTALEFDPQGSAPAADVLPLIQGTQPQLVISQTGVFQIAFLDPVTNLIETPGGSVEPTEAGVRLVFSEQAAADRLLLPRTVELEWDAAAGILSFSGAAEVSRTRLLELFPDLYADEQFFDPTPGWLEVTFELR